MGEASIALALHDNFSQALVNARNACTPFRSDVAELGQELDRLNARKVDLKVDMTRVKNELAEAKKAFKTAEEGADEMDKAVARANLAMAEADYSNLTEELSVVSQQAKQTQKDILAASDAVSKADNRAAARTGGGGALSGADALGTLGKAGLTGMLGQSLGQVADAFLGSALGGDTGAAISGGISSAAMGAAMGSVIPGIGTAIGAAMGGLAGLVSGAVQVYQKQDEAFKSYVQEQYSALQSSRAAELESGGSIAAGRETDLTSFTTMLGSREGAVSYLEDVKALANSTPFLYDDLTGLSKTLLTFGTAVEDIIPTLTAVGDAGAAIGMGTADINTVATALGRMQSTDKASLEYMNLLTERGIGALNWLAEKDNISVAEVYDNISKGNYSGREVADFIIGKLGKEYAGAMEAQSQTYAGLSSTLEGWTQERQNALGDAYNETAKTGMQEDIAYLQGEAGDALAQMNAMIGEGKALAENLSGQYQREAMSALLLGTPSGLYEGEQADALRQMHEEYTALQKQFDQGDEESKAIAAANMERLKSAAEGLATDAYNVSDVAKGVQEAERDLVSALQDNTAALQAYMPAFELSQQQDKGQAASAFNKFMLGPKGDGEGGFSSAWTQQWEAEGNQLAAGMGLNSHATGLKRVPFDNYPALLHQDEEVVPASEARGRASGRGGGGIVITGNEFHIRQESDIRELAAELMREVQIARMAGEYDV